MPNRRLRPAPVRRLWSSPLRIAAAVAALVIASVVLLQLGDTLVSPAEEPLAVYVTDPGERMKVRLADGTEIELNVDSRLVLDPAFGNGNRAVQLTGQAFFDVAHNAELPFTIETDGAAVRVLGTSFDVDAYPDAADVTVGVREGRVEVRPTDAPPAPARLTVGQLVRVDKAGDDPLKVEKIDPARTAVWRSGELRFRGQEMREVARTLERWHDVEIEFADPEIGQMIVDAAFTNEALTSVLESLSLVLGLETQMDGSKITLRRAN